MAIENMSLNQTFDGAHFHHMYLNGNRKIGIYIPSELHLRHRHRGNDVVSLRTINKASLEWLCHQETITGDHINIKKFEKNEKRPDGNGSIISIDSKNRVKAIIPALIRDELKLKNGDKYIMKKGRGRKIILDFNVSEDK